MVIAVTGGGETGEMGAVKKKKNGPLVESLYSILLVKIRNVCRE